MKIINSSLRTQLKTLSSFFLFRFMNDATIVIQRFRLIHHSNRANHPMKFIAQKYRRHEDHKSQRILKMKYIMTHGVKLIKLLHQLNKFQIFF